jgi:predicted RNA polymerase sigma factor
VLSTDARVALTLRLLGGLSTDEIARAFLVPEPTIAQRIVRAKRTLAEARVPFEVPRGAERARAAGVGAGGDLPDLQRRLCRHRRRRLDAPGAVRRGAAPGPRAGRLMPDEAEVHGLQALMELQASRLHARTDAHGRPVLLPSRTARAGTGC